MVDISLIQNAIFSLNTAAQIAKSFLQLHTAAEVQGKVIELQSAILAAQTSALAAQSEQATMIQRIRDLEEEIARVKAWEETKQRYTLMNPYPGFFTYALKAEGQPTEPAHWICAKCYEDGIKSILHTEKEEIGRKTFQVCPRCKTRIQTSSSIAPDYISGGTPHKGEESLHE